MKKMLQNFNSSLSTLFVIWQDFVIVWQNIPCSVCHTAMACLPHWWCWTVLPDGAILHACVHGHRKEFFAVFLVFSTAQWQLQRTDSSGLARIFDYDIYQRTQACLLCIFVPPPTVPLHWVVSSGSFHWTSFHWTMFIYFRYPIIILKASLTHGRSLNFVHLCTYLRMNFVQD